MKDLLAMVRGLPPAVRILLLCATARSLSFFAVLAYMPIFLHGPVGMSGATIGYVLGASLLVGTIASVYGGYLADRFVKVDLMIALDGVLVLVYLALPVIHDPLAVPAVLLVANTASSSMGVTANALLADLVPSEQRAKVFSLRYSLQNIGAAVGPFLGVATVAAGGGGPFLLAAGIIVAALLPLIVFRRHFVASPAESEGSANSANSAESAEPAESAESAESEEALNFREVLRVMRADRALAWFTLGGIFSIVVYGPLLTFMSQYLVMVESRDTAYRLVAYISAANAVVVISTQYLVGSRLKDNTLMRWLTWGTAAFVVGLIAMSLSTHAALLVAAVALFTLGEVIVVPAEYMFIDSIAPSNLRGSYFGAQNLVHIGVAIGPVVCGFLLQHFAPAVMFYTLVAIVIAGWWFYVIGCRAAASAAPAPANGKVVSEV
ncbi:MFS transporter [Streptomyces sp. NBC_01136]|uniref:MFS transporter n=1 Tax=unclassified Streptomyces TaxID=2593676 RepID=UPI003243CB34|nr:MFS transporter [Streptomyces sp. NBC_01136]